MGRNRYRLSNGFSSALPLCKKHGDVIWIKDHETPPGTYERLFVSVLYTYQIYELIDFARANPHISMIAGGPGIRTNHMALLRSIPDFPENLLLFEGTVESYFGEADYRYDWDIDFPAIEDDIDLVIMGYRVSNKCYWNKCIFCTHTEPGKDRSPLGFERFNSILDRSPYKNNWIFILHPSIPAKKLGIITQLPKRDNATFSVYLRAGKAEANEMIRLAGKLPNLCTLSGVEFPSNRMLKYFNKGITTDSVLFTAKALVDLGIKRVELSFIRNIPGITRMDLDEADAFFSRLPKQCVVLMFALTAKFGTQLSDDWKSRNDTGVEGSNWTIPLTDEERELNAEYVQIAKSHMPNVYSIGGFPTPVISRQGAGAPFTDCRLAPAHE